MQEELYAVILALAVLLEGLLIAVKFAVRHIEEPLADAYVKFKTYGI